MDRQRRDVLRTFAVGAAALAAGGPSLLAQDKGEAPPGKAAKYEPKPLPFDPKKLDGLSEKLLVSHHANNYTGAVNNYNKVEQHLASLPKDAPGFAVGGIKYHELAFTNSIILHEVYFGSLGGNGKYGEKFSALVAGSFGGLAAWEQQFRAAAMSLGGGSGWVVLALNTHTGSARNYWSNHHTLTPAMGVPLLVLDMYEHSYHIDFGAGHARYIDAFFRNVNGKELEARTERAAKVAALLK